MNSTEEKNLIKFLSDGKYPKAFSSNKSNFIAAAAKYTLNKKKVLLRNSKFVISETMQDEIFNSLHQHSGRTNTWDRIKSR